jgi:RHS repeat-associated protein
MKNMLNTTQSFGRALIAALALGFTCNAGFAAESHYYVNDPLATTVAIADSAGEIAAMEADAFGAPLAIGEAPGRFTGKPYDADLGAFVFPFRNYRPEEGRWMSADPSGFPDGLNGRFYLGKNPLRYVDPFGLAIGDPFSTPDAAANDAMGATNPASISENKEKGGLIYQVGDQFYATNSRDGTLDGFNPSDSIPDVPSNGTAVGDYHTHGATDPAYDSEKMSDDDIAGTNTFNNAFPGWISYLITPTGKKWKYDPKNNPNPVVLE